TYTCNVRPQRNERRARGRARRDVESLAGSGATGDRATPALPALWLDPCRATGLRGALAQRRVRHEGALLVVRAGRSRRDGRPAAALGESRVSQGRGRAVRRGPKL